MTWRTRYLLGETLIIVGVILTYFVRPHFFPIGLFAIIAAGIPPWIDWIRQGNVLAPITLKNARESLAMEICCLTVGVVEEFIKMDGRILGALVPAATIVGYVLGRWVWSRGM